MNGIEETIEHLKCDIIKHLDNSLKHKRMPSKYYLHAVIDINLRRLWKLQHAFKGISLNAEEQVAELQNLLR